MGGVIKTKKMETEKLIFKTDLVNIFHPYLCHILLREGFKKTGNKFSIHINGSKGYLHNIEIDAEGTQVENNRISCNDIFKKGFYVKKKTLNVFHSESKGVRLCFGKNEKPQTYKLPF